MLRIRSYREIVKEARLSVLLPRNQSANRDAAQYENLPLRWVAGGEASPRFTANSGAFEAREPKGKALI